jgi:hypothetical protein
MKEFKAYYRDTSGELQKLEIAANSKTVAKKSAMLHAKKYNLRFIGFQDEFQNS